MAEMENTKVNNNSPLKKIVIALAAVAVILLGVLIYISVDRARMINDLTFEKEMLTQEMIQLKEDYSELQTSNDTLSIKLDREREKVDQLIERIKETEASNRRKIRQYQNELGTLRAIMKNYIVQIDSLNTLNIKLKKDAAEAKAEARRTKEQYEQLSKKTDEFARKVEEGSVLKGRDLNIVAINKSNKETKRSSRTVKLKTCISLIENSIAERGPKTVYIRVKGPDGILMADDQNQVFNMNGESMIYSASREVDYQGEEIEICIYFAAPDFTKGVYTVDAYVEEGKLGSGEIVLR